MTIIEHLQIIKRQLDQMAETEFQYPSDFTRGFRKGARGAAELVGQQIKIIEAGEGEKA